MSDIKLTFLLESILFVSQRPLSARKLSSLTQKPLADVRFALDELINNYSLQNRGIILMQNNDEFQFVTHPDASARIQAYMSEEVMGELTRPALETLSVIAYRGPVKKSEIEKIRGVNCSLALRNLSIRGLVEDQTEHGSDEKIYSLSMTFLRHLGVVKVHDLPEYERLHSPEILLAYSNQPGNNS
ncbi:SMC-Scp complex subunit ScpB [Candidatus Uhrbacteria bacterium]|nr:SMC-Scp complex subunit ScpB [Candidatus Uhrbacteria bacterium]